jgi:hypothetical protein
VVTIDIPEYYIDNLPKVMGVLKEVVSSVQPAEPVAPASR